MKNKYIEDNLKVHCKNHDQKRVKTSCDVRKRTRSTRERIYIFYQLKK